MSEITEKELDNVLSHPIHDKMSEKKDKDFFKRLFHVLNKKDKITIDILYEKMVIEYLAESYKEMEEKANSFQTKLETNCYEGVTRVDLTKYTVTDILIAEDGENFSIQQLVDNIKTLSFKEGSDANYWKEQIFLNENSYRFYTATKESKDIFYGLYGVGRLSVSYYFCINSKATRWNLFGQCSEKKGMFSDVGYIFIFKDYEEAEKFLLLFRKIKENRISSVNTKEFEEDCKTLETLKKLYVEWCKIKHRC
jgi:hypothetical protein